MQKLSAPTLRTSPEVMAAPGLVGEKAAALSPLILTSPRILVTRAMVS